MVTHHHAESVEQAKKVVGDEVWSIPGYIDASDPAALVKVVGGTSVAVKWLLVGRM